MIEKNVPRDMSKYEAKLIGPFTTRHVVCLVPGAIVAVLAFFALKGVLGDAALLVSTVLALPFGLCGMYKPYGIPFERYAKTVFYSVVLSPTKKKYKSENTYSAWFDVKEPEDANKGKQKAKNKKKGEVEPAEDGGDNLKQV